MRTRRKIHAGRPGAVRLRCAPRVRALHALAVCAITDGALAACSAPEGGRAPGAPRAAAADEDPCATFPTDSAYRVATLAYIGDLEPKPLRFLNPAGTDTALPDAAFAALQTKGPSYLYAGPEEAKQKLREKLEMVGPWPALLVAYGGSQRTGDSTAVIRLRGHYIVGDGAGTTAPERAVQFTCGADGWRMTGAQEEKAT
jgi:hypothetical protein